MPFHIEVSSPVNRARLFNVDEATLSRTVLEPWVASLPFEFGEQRWNPRESRLTILRGPELDAPDGAPEQSWSSALRAGEDVTRPMLEAAEASTPPQTAMVVEADSLEAALQGLRTDRLPQQIKWSAAVERVDGRDPEVMAMILVVRPSGADWLQF